MSGPNRQRRAPPAPADTCRLTIPQWLNLKPEVREPVIALLTRMLQHHLPAQNIADEREVADEPR